MLLIAAAAVVVVHDALVKITSSFIVIVVMPISQDVLVVILTATMQVLDDQTFAALQSVMLFNNVEILHKLQRDPAFFPDLFKKLRTTAPKVGACHLAPPRPPYSCANLILPINNRKDQVLACSSYLQLWDEQWLVPVNA